MNSWGGNIVARYVAGIYKVRDCTAGFRAIRTTLLKQISFDDLRVQGYAFQVALLHEAVSLGAVVKEVPVDFIDRTEGESKLGISDIIEFVLNAWWIRLHSSRTFIKFAIVGLSGVIVNLGVFKLLLPGERKQISCFAHFNRSIDNHQLPSQQLLDLSLAQIAGSYAYQGAEIQYGVPGSSGGELFHFRGSIRAVP